MGQVHSIAVELVEGADPVDAFHRAYRERFGHAMPGAPVELVQLRLAAIGKVGASFLDEQAPAKPHPESVETIILDGVRCEARIVHRESIGRADVVAGPAILLEAGSTTLVPPGWTARQERFGTLTIRKAKA